MRENADLIFVVVALALIVLCVMIFLGAPAGGLR
jgi:hypothetical protein